MRSPTPHPTVLSARDGTLTAGELATCLSARTTRHLAFVPTPAWSRTPPQGGNGERHHGPERQRLGEVLGPWLGSAGFGMHDLGDSSRGETSEERR